MRDDDDDDEPLEVAAGKAEGLDTDQTGHRPGLYIPDLSSLTGWTWHHVDHDEPTSERLVGFRVREP